jgi:4'-phosphopantetheinyl transferase
MLKNQIPDTFIAKLDLKEGDRIYSAYLCLCYSPSSDRYFQTITYLHPNEMNYYLSLKQEERVKNYLAGRYAAKRAVSSFENNENLQRIIIEQGIFGQPIVVLSNSRNIQVSITHCDEFGAAIAFMEKSPMGIDIEGIDINQISTLESQITIMEEELIKTLAYPYEAALTLFWSAKESLSKILKTGLTSPYQIYEINQVYVRDGVIINFFENFPQYSTVSYIFGNYVCSLTYPKWIDLNIRTVKNLLHRVEKLIPNKGCNKTM